MGLTRFAALFNELRAGSKPRAAILEPKWLMGPNIPITVRVLEFMTELWPTDRLI